MRRVTRFYNDQIPNNQFSPTFPKFSEITDKWSDYKIQSQINLISKWLYPSEQDDLSKLDKGLVNKFRVNIGLRKKVFHATLRMLAFFGYTITKDGLDVTQIKPILREQNNLVIGLQNPKNYKYITRILHFLTEIRMNQLSELFFLSICKTLQYDPEFKKQVFDQNVLKDWIKTQPYLEDYIYDIPEHISESSVGQSTKSAWDD